MRVLVALMFAVTACADDGGGDASREARALFSSATTNVDIEIDFAPGATPYVGGDGLFGNPWRLTRKNLEALFSESPKTIVMDETLADMQALDSAPGGPDYTVDELLALADSHRDGVDAAGTKSFYVLFVDGYFADKSGRQDTVLGVSIGTTGVIAMFKPVIAGTGLLARRVEQTTLLHELGHAFGLVDNGLSPVDAGHVDREHGAHCTSDQCIMYWQNKVGSNLATFIAQRVTSEDSLLFDADCLDDAHAASR